MVMALEFIRAVNWLTIIFLIVILIEINWHWDNEPEPYLSLVLGAAVSLDLKKNNYFHQVGI